MKRAMTVAVMVVGLCALACGGLGASSTNEGDITTAQAPPALRYGDVAYKTFEADRGKYRIVFSTRQKARKTWSNMSGPAVEGTWSTEGQIVHIEWDSAATHHGSLSESFEQTGPCNLIRFQRQDRKSGEFIEKPMAFEQSEPRCNAVQVVQ